MSFCQTARKDSSKSCLRIFENSGCLELPPDEEFMEIYGKVSTNCMDISTRYAGQGELENIGTGVYLDGSVLDHSCAPNAEWFNEGKKLCIRIIEDVGDFKDIRISYLGTYMLTAF